MDNYILYAVIIASGLILINKFRYREVKDSVKEEEKNKIIYRVVPLIKDGTTYYDDIEISDIYESYSKKIWTRFGIKLRFLVRNSKK